MQEFQYVKNKPFHLTDCTWQCFVMDVGNALLSLHVPIYFGAFNYGGECKGGLIMTLNYSAIKGLLNQRWCLY